MICHDTGCRILGTNILHSGQLPDQSRDPGLGAGATLVRAGSPPELPRGPLPVAAQSTDRQTATSAHTDSSQTPQPSPSSARTHATHAMPARGLSARWVLGLLVQRSGQPSSQPRRLGRGCCPVPPGPTQLGQQRPSPAPQHADVPMQLFAGSPEAPSGWAAGGAQGAQQPLPEPQSSPSAPQPLRARRPVPFIQASSSGGARAGF